jgi:hypothetical protein
METEEVTDFKTLRKLAIEIHNTRVTEAYGNFGGDDAAQNEASDFLLKNLSINKSDTMERLLIKMQLFYFAPSHVRADSRYLEYQG